MSRKTAVFLCILIIFLGLVAGWFLQQWWQGPPAVSPVAPKAASAATTPVSKEGFCCVTPGTVCTAVATPGDCFRSAGRAFNSVERNCDYYCLNVKP